MLKNLRKTQIKSITLTIYRTEWSGVLHHTMLCVINTPLQSKSESEVTQSCPTLCDPMDCSLPGPLVHGIFQARVLEWVINLNKHAVLVAWRVKHLPAMWETQFNPWVWKIPGEGNGNPLQYSGLENSMDFIVHGIAKSGTRMSDFT